MPPHPLFFQGGNGSRLTDLDDNTYLDYVLGWGPVILGHGHPGLTEAVQNQLPHGATYGAGHVLEAEVAEMVIERIPGAERVLWSNTGSEATQVALRLARGATGRRRFIKFGGHYHGWSDAMLVGYRPGPTGDLARGSEGQPEAVLDDVTIVDWGDIEAVRRLLQGDEYAAVFCEPVLCNSGVLAPPENFLTELRRVCDATGTVLVFDEVITGFRMSRGGAAERYDVEPDLVVLAKAVAGGYPLAAVAGRAEFLELTTSGVVHAGTYNGNPVVLAAAKATLEALDEPSVYETFENHGRKLGEGFAQALTAHGVPGTINQVGPVVQCMIGVKEAATFTDFLAADQKFYDRLLVHMLRRGVFTLPGGRWYLSAAHSEHDVEQTVDVFEAALKATLADGATPATVS
ncbi:aspartate aminotransferase family protein [Nesterenkonia sphaerica]|uniref:Aspartate aminotransferase family protein n=1 Tax=Nesterenkonia sphaerica TaxID=1804988 RepID=A0A5R9APV9_9MICC|nr:aspartate aminotransferase family protein [Nesterenkonia sphaerica]TLP79886.1 aspartate aminotransferase family protein [Nesterenkonia sphaerica]